MANKGERNGRKRKREVIEKETDFNMINYEDIVPVRPAVSELESHITAYIFNKPKYGGLYG